MTFWRNKKIKKFFFTFFQWQKQPSIDWTITLSTCFGGRCKAKNTAFHSKRNLEEMYDKCWTPNLQPQSRKFVKKKKKSNVFKFKKKSRKCVRVRAHSHSLLASLFIRFLFGIMSSVLRGSAPHLLCWFPCVTYVYVTVFSMFYILYYS